MGLDWIVGTLAYLLILGISAFLTCLVIRIRAACSLAKSRAVPHTVSVVYGAMGAGRSIYIGDYSEDKPNE